MFFCHRDPNGLATHAEVWGQLTSIAIYPHFCKGFSVWKRKIQIRDFNYLCIGCYRFDFLYINQDNLWLNCYCLDNILRNSYETFFKNDKPTDIMSFTLPEYTFICAIPWSWLVCKNRLHLSECDHTRRWWGQLMSTTTHRSFSLYSTILWYRNINNQEMRCSMFVNWITYKLQIIKNTIALASLVIFFSNSITIQKLLNQFLPGFSVIYIFWRNLASSSIRLPLCSISTF